MLLGKTIVKLGPMSSGALFRRNFTYGPPLNRISLKEKIALFSGAMVIIAGPMLWIMGSLKRYQGKEE